MATLLEDPLPMILFGIIAEAVLGVVLLRTGRGVVLLAMIGVLLLVAGGVWVEWLVVTEKEQVEAVVEGVAAAVEANDPAGVKRHIDPSASRLLRRVNWAYDLVDFTEAKITNLEISINDLTSPPTARAHLTGIVAFEGKREDLLRSTYVIDLDALFRRTPEGWLITGYENWKNDPLGD